MERRVLFERALVLGLVGWLATPTAISNKPIGLLTPLAGDRKSEWQADGQTRRQAERQSRTVSLRSLRHVIMFAL